jgi:hypothetical protein
MKTGNAEQGFQNHIENNEGYDILEEREPIKIMTAEEIDAHIAKIKSKQNETH